MQSLEAAQGWRAAWMWAGFSVLGLRVGLGLLMTMAWSVVRPYMPASMLEHLRTLVRPEYGPAVGLALEAWPRWDAMHYFAIAQHGYLGVGEGDTVFYPLYPALVAGLAPVLGGD